MNASFADAAVVAHLDRCQQNSEPTDICACDQHFARGEAIHHRIHFDISDVSLSLARRFHCRAAISSSAERRGRSSMPPTREIPTSQPIRKAGPFERAQRRDGDAYPEWEHLADHLGHESSSRSLPTLAAGRDRKFNPRYPARDAVGSSTKIDTPSACWGADGRLNRVASLLIPEQVGH